MGVSVEDAVENCVVSSQKRGKGCATAMEILSREGDYGQPEEQAQSLPLPILE